jgi:hypothetical protein
MATKKTVAKSASAKRREDAESALELSKKAKAEVAKLLKSNPDDPVTQEQLETGLKEVEKQLKKLLGMIRHLL